MYTSENRTRAKKWFSIPKNTDMSVRQTMTKRQGIFDYKWAKPIKFFSLRILLTLDESYWKIETTTLDANKFCLQKLEN